MNAVELVEELRKRFDQEPGGPGKAMQMLNIAFEHLLRRRSSTAIDSVTFLEAVNAVSLAWWDTPVYATVTSEARAGNGHRQAGLRRTETDGDTAIERPRTYESAERDLAREVRGRLIAPELAVVPLGYRGDGMVRVEVSLPLSNGTRIARCLELTRALWVSEKRRDDVDFVIDNFVSMFGLREETESTPSDLGARTTLVTRQ